MTVGVVLGGLALTGLLVGVGWHELAPRMAFRIVSAGNGVPVRPESEELIAGDGWFTLLTLAVGVVAALVLWRVRSTRGPAMMVALAVGGTIGAVVAWRFGSLLGPGPSHSALQRVGQVVYPALRLRAVAALLVQPLAGVVTYLVLVGFAARNDLGRPDPGGAVDLPPTY